MCVTSLLRGPRADLWAFYGFLCKRSARGRGFFYQKPILKKRSPDQKSRCRTCAEACHSPFKPCTASLCGKVSPCLWWSRLGFYLEDFFFSFLWTGNPLTSVGKLPSCSVHCSPPCFFRTECPSRLSLWPLWRNSRAFVLLLPLSQSGLDWIQSLLVRSSPLAPAITVRHVLFGFSSDELLCVPRVFCYLLSLLKFLVNVMIIVFP